MPPWEVDRVSHREISLELKLGAIEASAQKKRAEIEGMRRGQRGGRPG